MHETDFDEMQERFDIIAWDMGFWGTLRLFVTYPWLKRRREKLERAKVGIPTA